MTYSFKEPSSHIVKIKEESLYGFSHKLLAFLTFTAYRICYNFTIPRK